MISGASSATSRITGRKREIDSSDIPTTSKYPKKLTPGQFAIEDADKWLTSTGSHEVSTLSQAEDEPSATVTIKPGFPTLPQLLNAKNLPDFIIQRQMGVSTVKDFSAQSFISSYLAHRTTSHTKEGKNCPLRPSHQLKNPSTEFLKLQHYDRVQKQLVLSEEKIIQDGTFISLWKKEGETWCKWWEDEYAGNITVLDDHQFICLIQGKLSLYHYNQNGVRFIKCHTAKQGHLNSNMESSVIYAPESDPPVHICLQEPYEDGSFWIAQNKESSRGCITMDFKSLQLPLPGESTPPHYNYTLKMMKREDGSLLCYKCQRCWHSGTDIPERATIYDSGNLFRLSYSENKVTWHNELEGAKIEYVICDNRGNFEALAIEGENDRYIVKIWSSVRKDWIDLVSYKNAKYVDVKRLAHNTYITQAHRNFPFLYSGPSTPRLCQHTSSGWLYSPLTDTAKLPLIMSNCLQLKDGRIVITEDLIDPSSGKQLKLWTQFESQCFSTTIVKFNIHLAPLYAPCIVHEIEPGTIATGPYTTDHGTVHFYDLYNPQPQREEEEEEEQEQEQEP